MNSTIKPKIQQYLRQRQGMNLCYKFACVFNFTDIVEAQLAVKSRIAWLWERRNTENMEVHCRTSIREAVSVLRKLNHAVKAEAIV
jgi:hypothetical protein